MTLQEIRDELAAISARVVDGTSSQMPRIIELLGELIDHIEDLENP